AARAYRGGRPRPVGPTPAPPASLRLRLRLACQPPWRRLPAEALAKVGQSQQAHSSVAERPAYTRSAAVRFRLRPPFRERWPSGLRRLSRKQEDREGPWVRIPLSPPISIAAVVNR